MKREKTVRILIAALMALWMLTGCGKSKEAQEFNAYLEEQYSAPEETGYPEPGELVSTLEGLGFETERYEEVGELGIQADRVAAVKDGQYLDICYGVADEQQVQDIMEYYMTKAWQLESMEVWRLLYSLMAPFGAV